MYNASFVEECHRLTKSGYTFAQAILGRVASDCEKDLKYVSTHPSSIGHDRLEGLCAEIVQKGQRFLFGIRGHTLPRLRLFSATNPSHRRGPAFCLAPLRGYQLTAFWL